VVSTEFILWVHREFCRRLPDDLLWVENPETHERLRVIPGELRQWHVKVGRLVPVDPVDIPAFVNRFADAYNSPMLSKLRKVIAVAASHHRLLWIHPFLDGNGRVTRLFSHAWLRELGIGSELWAVSRGLARQVDRYKSMLMTADEPRRGDLDGRGILTQQGLNQFSDFFLSTCVEEAVISGEVSRGKAAELIGYETRQARTVLSTLIDQGYLTSDSHRGAVRLGFPAKIIDRWFPRLYVAPPK
jgi:Fic family protein